jgi:hypothetical protein
MNTFVSSIQTTLAETLRFSIIQSATTGVNNNVFWYLFMYFGIGALSLILDSLSEKPLCLSVIYDKVSSLFTRRHIVQIRGQTIITTPIYGNKTSISTFYTNDFKAIWHSIIENIQTNKTIYELQETKTCEKLRLRDEDGELVTNLDSMYIVSQKDRFLLDKDLEIYAYTSISAAKDDGDGKRGSTDTYEITIYSYKSNVPTLYNFIQDRKNTYLLGLAETRKNKQYMYSLVHNKYSENSELLECWRETPFKSSKTFDNVFFENKSQVLDKINFFMHNREWYDTHGIPYTLGIGLYGPPGTGKTSFIKALTNYMKNRHLVNVPMTLIQTKKQLNDFYFESRYRHLNAPNSVGFENKIIVIEDIDCAGDIVLERSRKSSRNKETCAKESDFQSVELTDICLSEKLHQMDEDIQKTIRENIMEESRKIITKFSTPSEEMITLDDILNLWDGLRETPGRILVISSNHYDRLDAAIRRPGRIDITLGLKNISHNTLREMYKHFYKSDIDESRLLSIEEDLYSPAEITNLYTLYRDNSDAFMDRLCENRKLV